MPIKWNELTNRLRPDKFTIRNALRRLHRVGDDPALDVLTAEVDIMTVLENLTEKYQG